jgi:peptidoglycan/LPS O-acetylase OafA/YrhL
VLSASAICRLAHKREGEWRCCLHLIRVKNVRLLLLIPVHSPSNMLQSIFKHRSKIIYFPGLNGIRFLAAFMVLLDHLELFKGYFGLKTNWSAGYSAHLGSSGVTIFFVLSGFLITFLLLKEKEHGTIDVKKFYIRRALRIWPVYYLIILISFFAVPHIRFLLVPNYGEELGSLFFPSLFTYSLLLANVGFVYLPTVAFANILWSVAVEEQFYAIWPLLIKHSRSILKMLLAVLAIYLSAKVLSGFAPLGVKSYLPDRFYDLVDRSRISSMVIGGLSAFLVFEHESLVKRWIFPKSVQWMSFTFFLLILSDFATSQYYAFAKNEALSFVVAVIITNVATNRDSIVRLENRTLNHLENISYGIYAYHLFGCVLGIKFFLQFDLNHSLSNPLFSIALIAFVTLATIAFAQLSYRYFEFAFLKAKASYSTLRSGNEKRLDA